jgi:hypothetical protein
MGQIKQALYTNSEKFTKKYGYIFTSLYLYEFQQQCQSNVKFIEYPIECNELSEEIIKHTLFNYFEELLKDTDININLIDAQMLYDLCELYDY